MLRPLVTAVIVASSALAGAATAAPPDRPYSPALVAPTMCHDTADAERLMSQWPPAEPLDVFACDPVAPDKVEARKCCLGTKGAPVNADTLGNYFCYCVPAKIVSVCGDLGGSSSKYPLVKANADWCIFTSTHPLFPKAKLSCQ